MSIEAAERKLVFRCQECGQFYSYRTIAKHRVCRQIADRRSAGMEGQ